MLSALLLILALAPFAVKDAAPREAPMQHGTVRVEDPTDRAFIEWVLQNDGTEATVLPWIPCAPETVWIHLKTTREYLETIPVETTDTTWVIRSSDGR